MECHGERIIDLVIDYMSQFQSEECGGDLHKPSAFLLYCPIYCTGFPSTCLGNYEAIMKLSFVHFSEFSHSLECHVQTPFTLRSLTFIGYQARP
jgi:hypothetical protein